MDKPEIINVLEDAQLAHQAGDFVNALKFYETFFDHALDDDPYALYGVRLSYCLNGWAKLADEFVGAKQRLQQKQHETLDRYQQTKQSEVFHDYYCISQHLGLKEEALQQFITLHQTTPKTAAKLVKYVWNDLIEAEQWEMCNVFLDQANLKLDELFAMFDESMRLKEFDPSFNDPKFEQHAVDSLIDETQKLVTVLRYNNRRDDINALERQFHQAVESRNHSALSKTTHAKASFLFVSH